MANQEDTNIPLCVDLDGTFCKTDTLEELTIRMLVKSPFNILKIPIWLIKGKAFLKYQLSKKFSDFIGNIPINENLLTYLKSEKSKGRKIYLATGCNEILARKIASKTDIFDDVFASNSQINFTGKQKAEFLSKKFGLNKFQYVGNDLKDIKVWENSGEIGIVSNSKRLQKKVTAKNPQKSIKIFGNKNKFILFKTLRLHQWIKNLLIFLPLVLSHSIFNSEKLTACIAAFFAFSFCASATYILNDLFDIENDRLHHSKFKRPLASGDIQIRHALMLVLLLGIFSFYLALCFSGLKLLLMLGVYCALTLSYSFFFKKAAMLDVIILAILYVFRIYFGGTASECPVSFWFATFSIFIFFSLASIKRFVEIKKLKNEKQILGRGYEREDLIAVSILGISSGFISILTYLLYIHDGAGTLYKQPRILFLGIFPLMWFIGKIWLMAFRGKVDDDPVVYAIKTKENYIIGAILLLIFAFSQPI